MEEMTGGASDASATMTARERRRLRERIRRERLAQERERAQAQTLPPSNISNDTNIIRGNIDNDRRQVRLLQQNNHPLMRGLQGDTDPHAYAISARLLPYPPLPDPQQHALEQQRARLRWEHQSRTAQQAMAERTRLHEDFERLRELNQNNIHTDS